MMFDADLRARKERYEREARDRYKLARERAAKAADEKARRMKEREQQQAVEAQRRRALLQAEQQTEQASQQLFENNKGIVIEEQLRITILNEADLKSKGIRRLGDKIQLPKSYQSLLSSQNAQKNGTMHFRLSILAPNDPEGLLLARKQANAGPMELLNLASAMVTRQSAQGQQLVVRHAYVGVVGFSAAEGSVEVPQGVVWQLLGVGNDQGFGQEFESLINNISEDGVGRLNGGEGTSEVQDNLPADSSQQRHNLSGQIGGNGLPQDSFVQWDSMGELQPSPSATQAAFEASLDAFMLEKRVALPACTVRYCHLPKALLAVMQPELNALAVEFGPAVRAALERALTRRSTLEVGDVVELKERDLVEDGGHADDVANGVDEDKIYRVKVVELGPARAVSLIDTDVTLELLPSVQFKAYEHLQQTHQKQAQAQAEAAAARQAEQAQQVLQQVQQRELLVRRQAEACQQRIHADEQAQQAEHGERTSSGVAPNEGGAVGQCDILFRYPHGARHRIQLRNTAQVSLLFDHAQAGGAGADLLAGEFECVMQRPHRVLSDPRDCTPQSKWWSKGGGESGALVSGDGLVDAGVGDSEVVFVQHVAKQQEMEA